MLDYRRAHITTYWMAQQIGFVVTDMERHFVGDVEDDALDEIRRALHFTDLARGSGPSLRVRDRLQKPALIEKTPEISQKWAEAALDPAFFDLIRALLDEPRPQGPD